MGVATIVFASTKIVFSIRCHRRRRLSLRKRYIQICRIREVSRRRRVRVEITGRKASSLGREIRRLCSMALTEFLWLRPLHKTILQAMHLPQATRRRIIHHRLRLREPLLRMIIAVRVLLPPFLKQTRMSVESGVLPTMTLTMKVLILPSLRIRTRALDTLMSHAIVPPTVMIILTLRILHPLHPPLQRRRSSLAIPSPALHPRPHAVTPRSLLTPMIPLERFMSVTMANPPHPAHLVQLLDQPTGVVA